jgi:hypothetical protein
MRRKTWRRLSAGGAETSFVYGAIFALKKRPPAKGRLGTNLRKSQNKKDACFRFRRASYVKVDRCFGVDNNAMREDLPSTFAKYRAAADKVAPKKRVQVSAILAGTDNCWEWCNGTCDHCRTYSKQSH